MNQLKTRSFLPIKATETIPRSSSLFLKKKLAAAVAKASTQTHLQTLFSSPQESSSLQTASLVSIDTLKKIFVETTSQVVEDHNSFSVEINHKAYSVLTFLLRTRIFRLFRNICSNEFSSSTLFSAFSIAFNTFSIEICTQS